jgi:hypothetical protein
MVVYRKRKFKLFRQSHADGNYTQAIIAHYYPLFDSVKTPRRLEETALNQHQQERKVEGTSFIKVPLQWNATNDAQDLLFAERLVIAEILEHKSVYQAYPTTLSLILLAHFIFLHQWNKRKSIRDVMVSYRTVVQKRQYHRAVLAILSHPSAADVMSTTSDPSLMDRNENSDVAASSFLQVMMGNSEGALFLPTRMAHLGRFLVLFFKRLQPALHPFIHGQLSGLPIFFYNSHLLWSCRALEPSFDTSWSYARVLLGLALIGVLLELRVTHNLLRNISSIYIAYQAADPTTARSILQTQQTLLNQGMGTLTVLTSGVLVLFHSTFPHIPIQLFPCMNSTVRWWWNPFMSFWCGLCVLTTLSWKFHPVRSVLYGTLSGCLWSSGLLSFLGESYWGNSMIIFVTLLCLLSMKADTSDSRWVDWLPCIGYVGWDHRGTIRLEMSTTLSIANRRNRMITTPIQEMPIPYDDESEDTDRGEGDEDVESRPLLPTRALNEPVEPRNVTEEYVLHGRLPAIDLDDDTMDNPTSSAPSNSHVRSRRNAGNIPTLPSGRGGRER